MAYFIIKSFKFIHRLLYIQITKSFFKKTGKKITYFPDSFFSFKSISLGSYIYIGPNAYISSDVDIKISDKVIIGPNVAILGGDHEFSHVGSYIYDNFDKKPGKDKEIVIGTDVWIGANVVILKGVKIGNGAIIGAGSVVTKNIPDFSICAGNPARMISRRFNPEQELNHKKILNIS